MPSKPKKQAAARSAAATIDVNTVLSAALLNALTSKPVSPLESLRSSLKASGVSVDDHGFPIAEFEPGDTPIVVTLVLGMRHRMAYTLNVWDEQGIKKESMEGVSWDSEPDIHEIPATPDRDKDHLFWDVTITQSATGAGDSYYVAVHVEQGGQPLLPPFEYSGPLVGTAFVSGSLVFKA